MKFSPELLEEIRRRIHLQDLIEGQTGLTFRGGKAKQGECPFCHGGKKTPCFEVRPEIGSFRCRSGACGEHGDVFAWFMLREGLTFPEAVRRAAHVACYPLPEDPKAAAPTPEEEAREAERRAAEERAEAGRRALTVAAAWFAEQYVAPQGEACRAYVERREWTDGAQEWGLGFAPDDWQALLQHLDGCGIPREVRVASGLTNLSRPKEDGSQREYVTFRHRLTGEILDDRGRLCGFWARNLGPDTVGDRTVPKILNTPEIPGVFSKGQVLFGLWQARPALRRLGYALLVEGQGDTIACHLHEHPVALASCGTAFTLDQARLVKRHVDHLVLCYDGDDAGRKATEQALELAWQAGLSTSVVELPEGEDPDSYLRKSEEVAEAEEPEPPPPPAEDPAATAPELGPVETFPTSAFIGVRLGRESVTLAVNGTVRNLRHMVKKGGGPEVYWFGLANAKGRARQFDVREVWQRLGQTEPEGWWEHDLARVRDHLATLDLPTAFGAEF
jgi:DNA primase